MPALAEKKIVEFHVDVPKLRVFRKLDIDNLDPGVAEKLEIEEGRADYVDAGLPRSFEITDEIMARSIGAAVVSEDGEILHEWEGADAGGKAEIALASARTRVVMEFDAEPAAPKRARAKPEAEEELPF